MSSPTRNRCTGSTTSTRRRNASSTDGSGGSAARRATVLQTRWRELEPVLARHLALPGSPRCGTLELLARGEHERVVARSPYELDGRGKAHLCRSPRQRQRRPSEHVEWVREADRSVPDRQFVRVGGRSNERGRRGQQQIDPLEPLDGPLAVRLTGA